MIRVMGLFLLRTKLAIEECDKHLRGKSARGPAIESYLTQHVLVILSAEMQQEIYKLLETKASSLPTDIRTFVSMAGKRLLRGVKKGEIAGFLGHFGAGTKEALDANVDERDVTLYNNAILARDSVAHADGSRITLEELKTAVECAGRILNAVQISLGT